MDNPLHSIVVTGRSLHANFRSHSQLAVESSTTSTVLGNNWQPAL